jgi:DNA-binding transcriptional LysR family regulator
LETAQLSYFLLACQFKNQAEAAAYANVAAATVSENIDALERELGMTLFQRGPRGHYPTEAARWLYQSVEPLLQAVEAAETILRADPATPIKRLEITSPLQFMAGRLSRAASIAARSIRDISPDIIATTYFALGRAPYVHVLERSASDHMEEGAANATRIVLDYAQENEADDSLPLLRDEWVAVSGGNGAGDGDGTIGFEALRKTPLFLPPLGETQLRQARNYCDAHDLPEPVVIEEDVGTFARLLREPVPFNLLAPRSLVMASVERLHLSHARLPVELVSPVVARLPPGEPAALAPALAYVEALKNALAAPCPAIRYKPRITLKQIRYFLAMSDHPSISSAARRLRVAQPALSNQLRKLERIIGGDLFLRRRTGLEANDRSAKLAALLRPATQACDRIVAGAAHYASARRERLAIGVLPMFHHEGPLARALAKALDDLSNLHPTVRLKVLEGPTEMLRRWVDAGEVGFALVEAQVSRSWQIDLAIEDHFGVVSNPAKALLPPGQVSLRSALNIPLALPGSTYGLRQILDKAAAEIDGYFTPQMEINSLSTLLALVRRMRLATILPLSSVQSLVEAGALQFNPVSEPVVRRRLSILFSPERVLTDVERSLIKVLKRELSATGMSKEAAAQRAIYSSE